MKKILYILVVIPILVLGQSQDKNYVKSITYKKPTTQGAVDVTTPSDAVVQITYIDGLGRPIQQIAHKQSNTGKDIVTHIEYDVFGRQTKEFLPYVKAPSLNYSSSAQTDQSDFYSSPSLVNTGNPNFEATGNPYSTKQLEASPLQRVLKQAAPGNAWALGSGNEIKMDYQTNETGEVKFFKATATWNVTSQLYDVSISSSQTHYTENELYKTITKNENWKSNQTNLKNNTTEEFKNNQGQVVLKRAYNDNDTLDTYYVYDQYGNLTYVLPPLAEGVATQTVLDNLGYQYKYDYRNRLVEKKLPGKQWEFIVYDKLDRTIASGPAFSPYGGTSLGWMIVEYDAFGRLTQTGWKQMAVSTSARNTNQNSINSGSTPFVLSTADILTKNYYDSYNFAGAPSPLPTLIEGQAVATNVKGMPTGTWTKTLDVSNANAAELTYTFYDTYDRPIRSYTSNYLGGYSQVDSRLDWIGKTEYTITSHKYNTNSQALIIKDMFEYSAQDKLTHHIQQINEGDVQLIAKNDYDELGQLINKNVGGSDATGATGLQTIDYSYNVRGWLKTINDVNNIGNDLFAFKINYNNPEDATALFNGNIAETYWKTNSDNKLRKYQYAYDNLNRLLDASYSRVNETTAPNAYRETMSYDKGGNIISLNRFGLVDDANYAIPIDQLAYTYDAQNKNQLKKVVDNSNSTSGFKDGTNTDDDYSYDANGNMVVDKNKNISQILYNHLNLPTKIVVGTNTIEYLYNATGQKITKKVTQGSTITKTEYLAGGFQYKNAKLLFFPHAEGYVNYSTSGQTDPKTGNTTTVESYNYVFNYTDHLGNIRLSYGVDPNTGTIQILEENHYYPFGLKHEGYNMSYRTYQDIQNGTIAIRQAQPLQSNYAFKYNGKELQTELDLNMYDMDMRDYDPAIGRWVVQDPVVHYDYSPYNAFDNNPVYWADPSGADSESLDVFGRSRYDSNGMYIPMYERGSSGNNDFEDTEQNNKVNVVVWFGNDGKAINKGYENDVLSLNKKVIIISNISNLNDLKRELLKKLGRNKINNIIIMSHGSVGQMILGTDGLLPNNSEEGTFKQMNENITKLQDILEPYLLDSNVCFTACNVAHSNKGNEGKGYEFISMFQGISKKTRSTFYFNATVGKANSNRFSNDDSKNLSQNNVIFPNSQKSQKWRAVQGGSISYKYSLYFTNKANIKFSPLVKRW